jgi:hypothetical protein
LFGSLKRVTEPLGRRRRAAVTTVSVVVGALVIAPTTAVAAPAYTFDVHIVSPCVRGTGPANDTLTITLKDRNGVVVDTKTTTTNGSGSFAMSNCFKRQVKGQDRIRATNGHVAREFVVPALKITVNRVTDLVSGRAPAKSSVSFRGCYYHDYSACLDILGSTNTKADGTFVKDFSSTDLHGGDWAQVMWSSPSGDLVTRQGNAPYATATVGDPTVRGYAPPGQAVGVKLRRSGSTIATASGTATGDTGYWSGDFHRSGGSLVGLRAGDALVGSWATDASLTIPTTSVTGNVTTDHVTGRCLPNRPVLAYAHRANWSSLSYAYPIADATGHFNADMSNSLYPTFDLKHGDIVEIYCRSARGDQVYFTGTVP